MSDNTVLYELTLTAYQAMAMRYSSVATLTLWLYEYLLTFDKEIRLIWRSRFTIIKLLFLANRYLPLAVALMDVYFMIALDVSNSDICKPALLTIGFMAFTNFFLAELVLALRAYVTWQKRKLILIIVLCALSIKTGASFVVTYFYLTSGTTSSINLFRYGCEYLFTREIEWIAMLFVFGYEIVILSLMIMAKRAHLRKSKSELIDTLVNDGVLYCLCIMAISLVNVFVVRFAPPIMAPFLVIIQGTLHNILCTRMLLRLRDADARRTSLFVQDGKPLTPAKACGTQTTASH